MVKQSKGKSIRGAKWFGQEQVFLETRGKPAECDPTRGIRSIIPFFFADLDCGFSYKYVVINNAKFY